MMSPLLLVAMLACGDTTTSPSPEEVAPQTEEPTIVFQHATNPLELDTPIATGRIATSLA